MRPPKKANSYQYYDHGSLYIEPDGTWRVIAPTQPGPQAYNPGGEMVMWTSRDQGRNWIRVKQLTHDSPRNHTYARRPLHAHPDFYALWADGHGRQPSESFLYFTNQRGDHVWQLPAGENDRRLRRTSDLSRLGNTDTTEALRLLHLRLHSLSPLISALSALVLRDLEFRPAVLGHLTFLI